LAGQDLPLAGQDLPLARANPDSNSKINFNAFSLDKRQQTYFSTPLSTLFHYVPLVFPATKPNCTNVMLIDSTIPEAQTFYDAANDTTLPVLFNSDTLRCEIIQLLANNTTINRLCVVATNRNMYNNTKLFINNETYFTELDVSLATYSNNVQFMIDLIKTYNIKTIDFLACESLKYTAWQNYYTLLQDQGCTIGASSDKTGNLAYGGNWTMESDGQNIQPVYFTTDIANYTTTLDTPVVNIVFGVYNPSNGNTTYNVPSPYDISSHHALNPLTTTYAIWNSTPDPVTVYLADTTATTTYNVEINVVPSGVGYTGNGSNVTIDGSGATIVPSSTLFNTTSLVKVVDTTGPLTNITIQNINVDVTAYPVLSSTSLSNTGWILKGGLLNASTSIFVSNCHVYSSGTLTISSGTGNNNGGIVGGLNNNGGTLTFTSCSVYSSVTLTISSGTGRFTGGIVGGYNHTGSTLFFTSCSVYSTSGTLTISSGGGSYTGGIVGGNNDTGSSLTFNTCSVYSTSGTLTISSVSYGGYNGGIAGGNNDSSTLFFTSCSVYSTSGTLTISSYGDGNGGIAGGGNDGSSLTFNTCSVYSSGTLTISSGGSSRNGGIVGNFNYNSSFTFISCSVYTTNGALTISSGGYSPINAGIAAGYNFSCTFKFTFCSVYTINGTLTISSGGYGGENGGISGGYNQGGSLTFTSCSVYSSGALTINSVDSANNGGIAGGFNDDGCTLIFTSCSIISTTSVILNDATTYPLSSFNYISGSIPLPQTNPNTIVDSGLICGDNVGVSYPQPSLLLVETAANYTNIFQPNAGLPLNPILSGFNLTGMDLTQVDFSYYDLTDTILPGKMLPYNLVNNKYTNALITDGAAIATNIVTNSGIVTPFQNTLTYTAAIMNAAGMAALVNGTNNANLNPTGALSLFVSSLYTAALQNYPIYSISAIFVPASTLFSVQTWVNPIDSTSLVQLINASVYPNTTNSTYGAPTTEVDLQNLSYTTAPYYYILVQNYPDNVTIQNGTNTLFFSANLPVSAVLTDVSFNYSINNGPTQGPIPVGDVINFDNYLFYVGSLSFLLEQNAVSNICFPAGTPIKTDQGSVPIDKIDITYHTIHNQPIKHITQTITDDNYLICFEKHALGPNYPSRKTVMSKDHKIYYRRKMMPAINFLSLSNRVRKVKYSGELLYNVLLSKPSTMYVNNIVCETLDPENIIAKLYTSKYSQSYKQNIIYLLNESYKKKDLYAYKNIVNRLT
jgi:hypothetical protein